MKTNNHQALLYDDNCPLCAAYTKAFVKTGMLSKENRIAFSTINIQDFAIDANRARHEIPLVNTNTGDVKYGVDALAEILNQKFPFVKTVLSISPVRYFFKKLYSFISYNRKIIVASQPAAGFCFDCSPDYSFKHRIGLAIFTWLLVNLLLLRTAISYFTTVHPALFLLWMVLPILLIIGKTKQQVADILVHSGITALLSIIIFCFSVKIFSWLFTSFMLFISVALLVAAGIFLHQLVRRYRFYKSTYNG